MARKTVYKLLFSIEALDKVKSEQADFEVTQLFEEDETVIGELYRKTHILVEDRYVIPLDYVKATKEFPYLKKESKFDDTISRIKEQAVHISEKESDQLDKVGGNVKEMMEGRTKTRLQKEAKSYKNGALIGLGSGVVLALYLKKSVWSFGIIGLALGGYVAHKIQKAKSGNNIVAPVTQE